MSLPQRKLHRLKNWDYSQSGYYFVTICTNEKRKYLSAIRQNGMDVTLIPTQIGQLVLDCWKRIEAVHPNVKLDYYCLMPNHLHGILILEENSDSLSHIIRSFKSVTTRHFNKLVTDDEKNALWQLSFYDRIIRNEAELFETRKYIEGNPSKWMEDALYVK
jgi:REP element-mobilizing transposase RayT